MSRWTFGLTDLQGVPIGPIVQAYERKVSIPLNGLTTASCRLHLNDPLVGEIFSRDGDVRLKVYQDSTLRFQGELTTAEEDTQGDDETPPSVVCTFAGPLWNLQKRWVGASLAGYSVIDPPIPASDIIAYLVTQANARKDTGIRLGTIPTLYPMTVGTDSPWTYKPVAEALTNLQDSKVPSPIITPLTYEVADNLDSVSGPSGVVDGRADLEGNTWDSNGSWNDWTAGTVGQGAGRAGFAVSPADSRWAISSLPARAGALIAGMDFWSSIRARAGQPLYFYMYVRLSGHTAATPESGNWLRVLCGFDTTSGYYQLQKKVGATITTLGTYSVDAGAGYYWDGGTSTTWYSIRLLVDDLGNYWVYNYLSPGTIGIGYPGISGQDDDLVTGGPLDDGTYAFGDIFGNGPPSGVDVGRGFRNVFLSDLTAPQSFDFEFVPEEPTADTNQSGVVGAGLKTSTLNVGSPQLGTTTTALFEYEAGSKTTRGYNRKLDREGLITEAACFPSDGSTTDVRVSSDATAEAARGLYQEVVPNNDVSDGQLRQALADLNVAVRKQARQLITFTPGPGAPVFGTDYNVGDYVLAQARVERVARFPITGNYVTCRVYGVDIEIDDNGKETVSPSLVPQ